MIGHHFAADIVTAPAAQEHDSEHDPRLTMAWVFALLLLTTSAWLWWSRGDDVRRLPEAQRYALYTNTLDALRKFCAASDGGSALEQYCARQAALALQFPACDATCRALAEPHRPHATR